METGTPGSENTTLNIHQSGNTATIVTQMAMAHLSTVQTVASEMRRRRPEQGQGLHAVIGMDRGHQIRIGERLVGAAPEIGAAGGGGDEGSARGRVFP